MKRIKDFNLIYYIIIAFIILVFIISLINDSFKKENSYQRYLLKESGSQIILYENKKVLKKFDDIYINSLPYKDRQKLKKGIEYSSLEDVYKAVEDYES